MRRFAAAICSMTLAALFYVYQEIEVVKVGYEIRKLEEAKVQALDRARALKYNIARMESPRNLERRLMAQKIELESPKTWQTLVMPGKDGSLRRQTTGENLFRPPLLAKFFLGTAQAEAKESSR